MKRSATAAAAAAVSALSLWAGQVPRPAPPLVTSTPSGQRINLADYKGKVVVVKFFLTDCPHCQRSAGVIMPIYNELRSRGLEVLGIAINANARTAIPEFARRFGVTYPMGMGDRLMVTTFADISAVQNFYVPYIFLVDRKGLIRFEHPGGDQAFYANEAQNLRSELELLLKEAAPRPGRKAATNKAVPKS
jgi:peroxiredoxin